MTESGKLSTGSGARVSERGPPTAARRPTRWLPALLFAALLLPAPALAQTDPEPADGVHALTLTEAIDLALERNRPLLDSRLAREVQRFALGVAEDRWTPRLSLRPFVSRDRTDRKGGAAADVSLRVPTGGVVSVGWERTESEDFEDSGARSFRIVQPLLKGAWGEIERAPVRQARLEEEMHVLAFGQTVADLLVEVVGAYRALTGAVRQVEIAETALRRAEEQLSATRTLIDAGRVAAREAGRSEATIASRELSLIRARNSLEAAQFRLIDILEFDGDERIRPREDLRMPPADATLAPLLEDVLLARNDFQRAQLQVELARIGLTVADNSRLPELALSYNWRQQQSGPTSSTVRLDATLTLNDRQPELARLRARTALRQAERSVTELRESISANLRQASNDVAVGRRTTELAADARALAERNLEVEAAKFGQGLSTTFEVAASEDALLQAEQAEADAIVAYLESVTRLDQVTGRTLARWDIQLEVVPQ